MLIDTLCSAAFYCPACGKVQQRDILLFDGGQKHVFRCENCGHELASFTIRPKDGLKLSIPCGVCQEVSEHHFSWHQLRRMKFQKIYCEKDHFELGYIGEWQTIAEFLDFNAAEYDALHPEEGEQLIERQQFLLAGMNRLHDLLTSGELRCDCGSRNLSAGIVGSDIVLECQTCGSSCVVPAHQAEDLQRLKAGSLELGEWKRGPMLDVPGK